MSVWALGLNHNTAPVDLRGRFAFALDQIAPALHGLRRSFARHPEAAILSTCNRTEIYCASERPDFEHAVGWLAQAGQVDTEALRSHTYVLQEGEAARHAFRVASGLDSMVLGEPQILGQIKSAVRAAEQAGALGATLNQLFQRSFAVAKEVRSSTAIGEHSISMAAAAVRLAGNLFEDLSRTRVLFVGAGEMIELAAAHFAARHPRSITIANRSAERSEKLAARLGASTIRLGDMADCLHQFDIVVSCTASQLPLIGLGAVERALKARLHRPMFMVDLAVPRDIEPEVKALGDVYLYTLDDLAQVVQTGQASRQAAVAQAEAIIETGVQGFMHWLAQRDPAQGGVVALIRQLQQQADDWRAAELVRAKKRLAKGEPADDVLEGLSRGVAQKFLHGLLAELHTTDPTRQAQVADLINRSMLRDK
ncbi:MAG: glutamyl-tRNA reductase [Burkholderiaceae bacterium]|jgi:glutamyl-tRNA reductase|nr:glutamyl-tRNA reductase [Burkholderiaceae bacterium]